jgi:GTP:adenosylcobinamide-phosphate guanylyltransferase
MPIVDALVSAGGRDTPKDLLYPLTRGQPKALLNIAGQPMIQWVLNALAGVERIGRVIIVGLDSREGLHCGDKPLAVVPDSGSMVDNIKAGAKRMRELNPAVTHGVWVGADVPSVRAEHLNWLLDTCLATDHEVYYTIIEKETMQTRFPESKRSYLKLKGHTFCGGDTHMFALRIFDNLHPVWEPLTAARKNAFRQAAIIGWRPLWLALTGQLTLSDAEQFAQKRLSVKARAVVCPHAEMGMDVDKPFQFEMMARDLQARGR